MSFYLFLMLCEWITRLWQCPFSLLCSLQTLGINYIQQMPHLRFCLTHSSSLYRAIWFFWMTVFSILKRCRQWIKDWVDTHVERRGNHSYSWDASRCFSLSTEIQCVWIFNPKTFRTLDTSCPRWRGSDWIGIPLNVLLYILLLEFSSVCKDRWWDT